MEYLIFLTKTILLLAALGGLILAFSYLLKKLGLYPPTTPVQPVTPYFDSENYVCVGQVLMECVANNHDKCGLCLPRTLAQHLIAQHPAAVFPQYGLLYYYDFDRKVNFTGGMTDGKANQTFSTTSASKIAKMINDLLGNYCLAYGFPPMKIWGAKDLPDGRIRFAVGLC